MRPPPSPTSATRFDLARMVDQRGRHVARVHDDELVGVSEVDDRLGVAIRAVAEVERDERVLLLDEDRVVLGIDLLEQPVLAHEDRGRLRVRRRGFERESGNGDVVAAQRSAAA